MYTLSHPKYRIGAESACSAKDYISQLPLHVGGTMALDITCGIEYLLSLDGENRPAFCTLFSPFADDSNSREWKSHKVEGAWVTESFLA